MNFSLKPIVLLLIAVLYSTLAGSQTLKVMSYNIHHGTDKNEKNTLEEMGEFIKKSGADLVGLQEVDSLCRRSGSVDQMKRLAEITGMHYSFVRHFAYDGGAYGLGILSRYPISGVRNDRISLIPKDEKKPSLALLTAKISLPGNQDVLFGTVHFALNALSRMVQAEEVMAVMKSRSLPAIITGDLNANPDSKEVLQLDSYFSGTAAPEAFTFPVDKPLKKIDYIMVSKPNLKKVIHSTVYNNVLLSDHLAISSTIRLKK
jgi:endonuclease/exonuclease/phosphatase family metal-dependent hydrolase